MRWLFLGDCALKLKLCSVCVQDAMRSVTKQAVREARLKEIKQELLNSEKLKVSGGRSPCQNFPGDRNIF